MSIHKIKFKKYETSNFKLLTALILPFFLTPQDRLDQIIDEKFGEATGGLILFYQIEFSKDIKSFWVLFPLIFGAAYFTLYFKFINFSGILDFNKHYQRKI